MTCICYHRRGGTGSSAGLITIAAREWKWIRTKPVPSCIGRYLVEIYWLLQACYCDHCETQEAPKKDDPIKKQVSAKCQLPPGEIPGSCAMQSACVAPYPTVVEPRDDLTSLWPCLLAWPWPPLGKTRAVSERILRWLVYCQMSLTRSPGQKL